MNLLASTALALGLAAGAPETPEQGLLDGAPEFADVLVLPSELLAQLETHVIGRSASQEGRRQRLMDFMFGMSGLNFRYDNSVTRTVPETFDAGVGNCLSFTLMFIAAARYVGLEAYGREVRVPPTWSRHQTTVYRTGHVNAGVLAEGRRFVVDFEPHPVRAYMLSNPYRGRTVSDERMLAHYFNNRAAELLGDGHLVAAQEFVERAIELDPEFTLALNTRGVLKVRLGQIEAAELAFETVLEHNEVDPDALINLFNLYRKTDQAMKAATLQARLDSLRPDDPYFHYELGQLHENQGDLDQAAMHYRRAANELEHEHRFHFALARIHFLTGANSEAEHALMRAADVSYESARHGYKAKLHSLRTFE